MKFREEGRLAVEKNKSALPPDRLAATLALEQPVSRVRQVSPARAAALEKMGIRTIRDLLANYPRRYIDLSAVKSIAQARIGESCTISGTVHEVTLKKPRPRLSLVEISIVDGTGVLIVTMFRQPWLAESIKQGDRLAVAGKVEFSYGFKRMTSPFLQELDEASGQVSGMVVPVHPACEKVSAAWMRRIVGNGLEAVSGLHDPLPLDLRLRYRLMSRTSALSCIHEPLSMEEVRQARRRLAYEELLLLELHLMQEGALRGMGKKATAHVTDGLYVAALDTVLPFALTDEQKAARADIFRVMAAPTAANHMLLGDVGTGKTVVAAFALAAAVDTGGQAMLLAPTEVLARQHAKGLGDLLGQVGITCALLTGSTPPSERAQVVADFAAGEIDVLLGTHALLEDDVVAKNLTLAVVDEQQRFGVDQRAKLLGKGEAPDALFLTATPIPRSLALALFGNLTLSYIKQRPLQTAPRVTCVVHKDQRGIAYDAALAALARGEQAYVVCPLVGKDSAERDAASVARRDEEESEGACPIVAIEGDGDLAHDDVTAASREAQILQETVFIDYKVELLHGKMGAAEKQAVMERFRSGETQVLVATTVIEVGVDVPNATVMIIEDADRFGLSQLHQLRGRVGRGRLAGEVYLVSASKHDAALARLRAMETTDDGFELATLDLSLRREGDILGNRQHGASVLKLVNVARDGRIIEAAHAEAAALLEADPQLEAPDHHALARELRILFPQSSGNIYM